MRLNCHLCGAGPSRPIPEFAQLGRVTSDCKPWPRGGHLFLCEHCGTVHKNTDSVWLEEMQQIYANYTIYPQSAGVEQPIFVPETGLLTSRSRHLLERFQAAFPMAERGRLLDVGCGNGALLRAFSPMYPLWSAVGTEFDEKYKALVEQIPGVEAVYGGSLDEVPGTFQLQTMVHVLEHIPQPGPLLDDLRSRLAPGGHLIVDLPDFQLNPFDLVVADHCTHFTEAALGALLRRHGFNPELITTSWIPKERVAVASPGKHPGAGAPRDFEPELVLARVRAALEFLHLVARAALDLRQHRSLGIFGTSLAGTWLYAVLEGAVDFWVEEDPARIGRHHLGQPIYAPSDAPAGAHVLIGMAPTLSARLREKVRATPGGPTWHVPEDWLPG